MKNKGNNKKRTKQKKKCLVRKRAQERVTNLAKATIQKEYSATVKSKESPSQPNDTALSPTADNDNSHPDELFLTVASKLSEAPLKPKNKSTSFHLLRNLL